MSSAAIRSGIGSRFRYDGDVVEVVEMLGTTAGNEVVLKNRSNCRIVRVSLRELLASDRAQVLPDGPGPSSDDPAEIASILLAELTGPERQQWQGRRTGFHGH